MNTLLICVFCLPQCVNIGSLQGSYIFRVFKILSALCGCWDSGGRQTLRHTLLLVSMQGPLQVRRRALCW